MSISSGIPYSAAISINDLLDNCAKVKPGQDVLLVAHLDGLYGGDNLVDREAISWIQSAIHFRGAHASVLWIDELAKPHAWRFFPVVKAAMAAADVSIVNSFDLVFEEIVEFKQFIWQKRLRVIRNFATTAPLLCSSWAQTPHELVSEIRYQAALPFKEGLKWQLTDENGTHLEGMIKPAYNPNHPWCTDYTLRRDGSGSYLPFPEWVHPPVRLSNTNGIFIFDCMLSWWSRCIGISPYFKKPIQITVEGDRMTRIEGGDEADALKHFLTSMHERLGDGVYDFNCLHFGVHPQASVSTQECPNILYRRLIEHCHSSNIHAHIGAPPATTAYPYWMHVTGDIRKATLRVGNTLVYDNGYLTALDNPTIAAIAKKYPGRPGSEPVPRHY